ncbi:uncharacterized protein LOC109827635 [Asparagus officinalis]|uniref:uncharacterized protein LOC109827635 n=1 Tax=Asparagus officinalis TaxID=4686 RepID=UPI00098DE9D9|nr:uncharacterized protein LOC109827635 [Asparagus officinalis]
MFGSVDSGHLNEIPSSCLESEHIVHSLEPVHVVHARNSTVTMPGSGIRFMHGSGSAGALGNTGKLVQGNISSANSFLPLAGAKKIANSWNWISNVRSSGKARILLLWDPDVLEVQPLKSSDQHITCTVKSIDGKVRCVITSVYGFNQMEARKDLWLELTQIKQSIGNLPWLLCGDFNVMINNEKLGGSILSEADTTDFKDFIENCLLSHLKTLGCFYTWNNKKEADSRVWCRLDRALVNDAWINTYNASHVEFLLPSFSDHSPAQIAIYEEYIQGKKPFKFFKMWTTHPSYVSTVSEVWKESIQGCKMFSVCKKLKLLKGALKTLNKKHFYNISEQVQRAKIALEDTQRELQNQPFHPMLILQEKELLLKYNNLIDCEMSFYQQTARIKWSLQGDRCTSLFHNIAKSIKHNNRVVILYNSLGERITEPEGIAAALGAPVTNDEIKSAVFSISESKAPGPDGFSMSFFKSSWSTIGEEITQAVHEFFRNGKLLGMANRAMVSIDIRKAFDTISWRFISDLLQGLGFPASMIKWIMACITSPSYSISLNGSLHGYFKGERGLRQGDPLSPYLFILGMEYLSRKLDLLYHDRMFKFHPKCKRLKITHLVFADDLLLFSKADHYSIQKLHQCVQEFGNITGLEANPDKCSIFLGGVDDLTKSSIINLLGFKLGELPFKYLGVPLVSKRLSYLDCNLLFTKIEDQFNSWQKHKTLSYAGRIQVIKSVILGIQTFWTSNFVLPVKVMQRVDSLCRGFLWGKSTHTFRTPLVSWEKICLRKEQGGLGLFSAPIWNYASALRCIWHIHINKELLWIKWIHGTYLKNSDIWHVNIRCGDSWMWRQLLKTRDKAISFCGGVENLKNMIYSCNMDGKIKLSALYKCLYPSASNVAWSKLIWERLNIPKHSFICWLAIQNRLLTQDRILKYGMGCWIGSKVDGNLVIGTNVCTGSLPI